ncbi:hypothetical protein IMCC3088_573 [Aequoribacter fuscus]|uniref:Uncharacterized protein n=1 Tax=Aequoribacter fuscus TaxID=2518989 RepID=F3KZW1_9GAMM|nr:hypothetical protein IMCC3088_573 [Aequoribacter fuscus]
MTEAWSNLASSQELVLWQSSQVLLLAMWFADLPSAIVPL